MATTAPTSQLDATLTRHTETSEPAPKEPEAEGERSLSTTTRIHTELRTRGIIVGVNLVIVLLSLVALWCATYSYSVRPSSERGNLLNNVMSKSFLYTLFMHLDVFILVLSVSLTVVAAFGLVGALRENIAVLEAYQSLLALTILLNSVAAVAGMLMPQSARNHLKQAAFVEFIQGYRQTEYFQHIIDALQTSMRCCGFSEDTFHDWNLNEYFHCASGNPSRERCSVPFSCCRQRVLGVNETSDQSMPSGRFCGHGVLLMDDQEAWKRVYTRSCADAALTYVMDNLVVFICVVMVVNMFLLFMLVTSAVLQDQVHTITTVYEAYYKTLEQGQVVMQEAGLIKSPEMHHDNKSADKNPDKANDKVPV
ncbi:tetraspanin-33 [Rhipicephalus sanguineus]|uniref:tetraspanin-33 n=1 Tax=Rhipicephalus sanguineus TaxID=34632 RepID=UPI001894B2F6|nr:tetraspanin-33 [Rhipicephalus sanguineus]